MRGTFAVFVVVIAASVLGTSLAAAETVVAKDGASVYLKPGESSKVVVKVKSGDEMTVVRRDGRWLKVRVKGRTGFIPRTKVSGGDDEGEVVARQTRRRPYVDGRSTDRGWGGEPPEDRRGIDAVENVAGGGDDPEPKEPNLRAEKGGKQIDEPVAQIDDEDPIDKPLRGRAKPDPAETVDEPKRETVRLSSGTQMRAKPGAKSKKVAAFLLEEKNGWARIESEDGERGWVSSKLLVSGEAEVGGPSKRAIVAGAKIGFTAITQGTRTAGGAVGIPDNYNLATSGVSASLGGSYVRPISKGKFLVGGELSYIGVKALPGINYMSKTTGITTHAIDLRAVGGYNLKNSYGMVAWGRLGYHYDAFIVADVTNLANNTARLPSESLSGVALGAALTAPTITKKIGAQVAFDALVAGSRSQTKNLEDGNSPSAFALWTSLGGTYQLARATAIDFGYRLGYVSNSFGAPRMGSMRMHTGTSVTRVDLSHTFSLGVSQSF
jgi:SH3-like domain-containing protein